MYLFLRFWLRWLGSLYTRSCPASFVAAVVIDEPDQQDQHRNGDQQTPTQESEHNHSKLVLIRFVHVSHVRFLGVVETLESPVAFETVLELQHFVGILAFVCSALKFGLLRIWERTE